MTLTVAEFFDLFGPSIAAALLAALLCGLLGIFVVLRRVAFVSAALGQVSGLGVALGFLAGSIAGVDPHDRTPVWLDPVVIALVLAGAAAAVLALTSRMRRTSSESVVAFAYLVAAAFTMIILTSPRIVQEAHEVNDLLFGNTVAVRQEHLVELAVVTLVVVLMQLFLFKDFVFISFDPEMARTLGLPVTRLELALNVSIGVSVAVATRAIGALPVFGFLVLPAGAALLLAERMRTVVAISVLGSVVAAGGGFYLSFVEGWPTGPVMVVCAAAYWAPALVLRSLGRSG